MTKMSLFNTNHNKSSRLEEFEQGQMQAIDQVGNYLKVSKGRGRIPEKACSFC